MNLDNAGGAAVFCAIICPSANIGLFIRQPDRQDPMWKIIAGEVDRGESVPAALLRETEEEGGFKIPNERDEQGLIVGNDDFRVVSLGSDQAHGRLGLHERHYFVVVVKDPREIIALDGQLRKEDDNETIETKVFSLDAIAAIPDFLPQQRLFLNRVLDYARKTKTTS